VLPQGEKRQPQIEQSNGDQDPAERNAIVNHEVQDAAALEGAQLGCSHAKIDRIMRQEVASRCLKNGEGSASRKKDG
jgi:hypothetical protein